jgi:hypothetical protein
VNLGEPSINWSQKVAFVSALALARHTSASLQAGQFDRLQIISLGITLFRSDHQVAADPVDF